MKYNKTKLLMKIIIIKSIDNQVIIYLLYITLKKKGSLVQQKTLSSN